MGRKAILVGLVLTAMILSGPGGRALAQDGDSERSKDPERAMYLKALGLFLEGKHEAAITALDPLTTRRTEGGWYRKALFLKARALLETRRFEEAEAIYESEARRLLGENRKEEIAKVVIDFADALAREPDPDDVGAPPPDYAKAHNLYRRALEIEIGRGPRDDLMTKSAVTILHRSS